MYFPFLRGKQFELIALREATSFIKGNQTIRPVIEPVKKKTSTYVKTLDILQTHDINFTVIINPTVGDVVGDIDYVCSNLLPSIAYQNFQIGIIVKSDTNLDIIAKKINQLGVSDIPIVLILGTVLDESFDTLLSFIKTHNISQMLTSPKMSGRRKVIRELKKASDSLVFLSDAFVKQLRNKDYSRDTDEFFSDEHLYFGDDGYIGYSDFLSVGKEYSEAGFSPYAVAIHLTYPNDENEFRVKHFVSNSNEDISDVAGKFEEALDKLVPFVEEQGLDTMACKEFLKLSEASKYPGLGTVKKLSILHHLELVHNFFS